MLFCSSEGGKRRPHHEDNRRLCRQKRDYRRDARHRCEREVANGVRPEPPLTPTIAEEPKAAPTAAPPTAELRADTQGESTTPLPPPTQRLKSIIAEITETPNSPEGSKSLNMDNRVDEAAGSSNSSPPAAPLAPAQAAPPAVETLVVNATPLSRLHVSPPVQSSEPSNGTSHQSSQDYQTHSKHKLDL